MTRLESGLPSFEPGGAELQQLIKGEAARLRPRTTVIKKRPLFSCFNCFTLIIILLVVGAGWLTMSIAKTGLVEIPVFTPLFYQTPAPSRWVGQPVANQKSDAALLTPPLDANALTLKEEDLTALLSESLVKFNQQQSRWQIKAAQVAFNPEEVELFTQFSRPAIYLTIGLEPQLVNGQPIFRLRRWRLGQLNLPLWLVAPLVEKTLNSQLFGSLSDLPLIFNSVKLEPGRLILSFSVTAD